MQQPDRPPDDDGGIENGFGAFGGDATVALGPNAVELSGVAIARVPLPERIGRFRVTGELGRGRYGTVFAVEDPDGGDRDGEDRDGRGSLAVKRISGAVADDPVLRARCLREAEVVAALDHPGVVRTYGVEEDGRDLLLVMERCGGLDLQKVLALRPGRTTSLGWSVEVVRQLAEAVGHGHARGVVHRDLKPANVMVDPPPAMLGEESEPPPDGARPAVTARVLDFGLALPLEDELRLTRTSMTVGTPLYMAPEQAVADRDAVGPPADVFGLGSILYELLCGEPPFLAPTLTAILDRLGDGDVRPPRKVRPEIPADLQTICLRCLRPEPGERYPDASALAADLGRFGDGEPVEAEPETATRRVVRWAGRRGRVETAGGILTALVGVLIAWSLAMIGPTFAIGGDGPRGRAEVYASLAGLVLVITPLGVTVVWAGLEALRGRPRQTLTFVALAISIVFTVQQAAVAAGYAPPPLSVYEDRPMARVFVFAIIAFIYGAASAALVVIALGGRHASGRREGVVAAREDA